MSTPTGGTQSIAAGIASQGVIFSGSVVTPYQVVSITPGWATTPFVVPATKLATGFTASFTIPAPLGGSSFDWEILVPTASATSLAQYLDLVRDLVHDPDDVYWSAAQKTSYINQGLQKRDRETGQNREVISLTTTVSQEAYTLTDLGNVNVFDVISIYVIYGNLRLRLGVYSLTELNELMRWYSPAFTSCPAGYSRVGPSNFIFAPAPAIAYVTEWDCSKITPRGYLVNLTDTDPLPAPYDAPVPYWAARVGKYNERAYDEAREFEDQFNMEVNRLDSNKVGMVPSLGGSGGWR